MCGIAGFLDLRGEGRIDREILARMTDRIVHRGPDAAGFFTEENVALGARRLSIIDLEGGDQPIFNEDGNLVLVCNGEIFNYEELRRDLIERGHVFRTCCDIEVLLHLYEEKGPDFLNDLNGQFAFAIYDRREKSLLLSRDHFGIAPLYYAVFDGILLFGSEIKAILEHPRVERRVDLTGLDQIFTYPGLVSPRTLFQGIHSLKSGHSLLVRNGEVRCQEYWDLRYPPDGEVTSVEPEEFYVEQFRELFFEAVGRRLLHADVPVGFYLSGGLDSSLIAAAVKARSGGIRRHTFSIDFSDPSMSEAINQRLMAEHVNSIHQAICFDTDETAQRLSDMIYFCECPVRETYNVCAMALSRAARQSGVKVVLTGEGSDEIFAGYVGYRFDRQRRQAVSAEGFEEVMEEELRERLWGDRHFFYEKSYYALREVKAALYSPELRERFDEFDCLNESPIDKERLRGLHPVHRRSYLDVKLRLSDHLLTDHGDRMALANSVEGRHPFLDLRLIDLATSMPPDLKLKGFQEKYIVRRAAEGLLPEQIVRREKFGWYSSGSPEFLQGRVDWVQDMLSSERIRSQGYFDPDMIDRLKSNYSRDGFRLNFPYEDDLLVIVLTFGLLVDRFAIGAPA